MAIRKVEDLIEGYLERFKSLEIRLLIESSNDWNL